MLHLSCYLISRHFSSAQDTDIDRHKGQQSFLAKFIIIVMIDQLFLRFENSHRYSIHTVITEVINDQSQV